MLFLFIDLKFWVHICKASTEWYWFSTVSIATQTFRSLCSVNAVVLYFSNMWFSHSVTSLLTYILLDNPFVSMWTLFCSFQIRREDSQCCLLLLSLDLESKGKEWPQTPHKGRLSSHYPKEGFCLLSSPLSPLHALVLRCKDSIPQFWISKSSHFAKEDTGHNLPAENAEWELSMHILEKKKKKKTVK